MSSIYRTASVFAVIFFTSYFSFAQESNEYEAYLSDIYDITEQKLGVDPVLANGVFFEDAYRNSIGHPYLEVDSFTIGWLLYHGQYYSGLLLKYDIYAQELQIKHPELGLVTMIDNDFLDEFSLFDKHFVHYSLLGELGIFQLVFQSEEFSCYYSFLKPRNDVIVDKDKLVPGFQKLIRKSYLVFGEEVFKYKGNDSFVSNFPKEYRSEIKGFMKENSLKVKKASDLEMNRLFSYCLLELMREKE